MSIEYLGLFSNAGSVMVSVRFSSAKDKHRSIADQSMHWHEIDRLIEPKTGTFYGKLLLDSHECPVKKYEIDPSANTLTIVIAETNLP